MTTQQPWAVPAEAISWEWSDWYEAFRNGTEDTYASYVVTLSDYQTTELSDSWLAWLFEKHGGDLAEYVCEASKASFAGLMVKPINHAGQALCWLGY